jgi:hypothetical protein
MYQAKHPVSLLAGTYGRPLHPILVTVSIGAWAAGLVFDLASHVADGQASSPRGRSGSPASESWARWRRRPPVSLIYSPTQAQGYLPRTLPVPGASGVCDRGVREVYVAEIGSDQERFFEFYEHKVLLRSQ